ncbi:glycosyltransferase family 2 protein [Sphingobium sp. TKS]|uniref:glycosyltransferase family 2 protein n=1 Tax=Sphingobium sp. TKS TaxID=1315974 RepID=UPI00077021B6|nr:glycosyltransferase family 2 protein [Sphingobium sp. TKS]AMK22064.1 putative glycosyltransferase [Sphingobium sp. TKS]
MPSNRTETYPTASPGLWLKLCIHFDAFLASPRGYSMAAWWRLRRKRLRSHSQFARLLGGSRRAYDMWLSLEEKNALPPANCDAGPPILALVEVGAGKRELEKTLLNLSAEGVRALVIGSMDVPSLVEAARQIHWEGEPWLLPMAAGDQLARGAMQTYRTATDGTDARIVYADDDLLNGKGRRTAPHFKPDWNSELFHYFDYLTGACILRSSRQELEAVAEAPDWARQLVTRKVGEADPLHVRKILHHRGSRPRPQVPAVPCQVKGELPCVTVIVPTRNRLDLLQTCLKGIAATDYPDVEVIVVDNDSDDPQTLAFLAGLDLPRHRVLRHAGAFNYSAINNRAVGEARGQLLCLLNNDIEVIEPMWLATMAAQALRADVGAVGARLLYPDGRIQHAGVVIGVGNAAGHAHRFLKPDEEGYFYRHALPQFTTAVTAACLVVSRERFLATGGLDECNFPVAFNDVDLCMRLNQRGWQSLYEPRATLIHHESVSRGFDRDPVGAARFAGELAALQRSWGTAKVVDPFHHPELSRASERFVVGL